VTARRRARRRRWRAPKRRTHAAATASCWRSRWL
jgi:hypothetical protein